MWDFGVLFLQLRFFKAVQSLALFLSLRRADRLKTITQIT